MIPNNISLCKNSDISVKIIIQLVFFQKTKSCSTTVILWQDGNLLSKENLQVSFVSKLINWNILTDLWAYYIY